MLVKVHALVLRRNSNGSIILIKPLSDYDDSTVVTYPRTELPNLTKEELISVTKGWSELTRNYLLDQFDKGLDLTIEGEAWYLPSFTDIKVEIESKEIEW